MDPTPSSDILADIQSFMEVYTDKFHQLDSNIYEFLLDVTITSPLFFFPLPSTHIPHYFESPKNNPGAAKREQIDFEIHLHYLLPVKITLTFSDDICFIQTITAMACWLTQQQEEVLVNTLYDIFLADEPFTNRLYNLSFLSNTVVNLLNLKIISMQSIAVTGNSYMRELGASPINVQDEILHNELFQLQFYRANNEIFQCSICYDERKATKFVVLECSHCFCTNCIKTMLENSVARSHKLKCPDCFREIQMSELSSVTDHETRIIIERYERLHQLAQWRKEGIVYSCPNCNELFPLTQREEDETLSVVCPKCEYHFCATCSRPAHIGKCKKPREEKNEEEENEENETEEGDIDYNTRRIRALKGIGKASIGAKEANALSEAYISSFRRTPCCNQKFLKAYGCSLIHCGCGRTFCNRCMKVINDGYSHFNVPGGCVLFSPESLNEEKFEETKMPRVATLINQHPDKYAATCRGCGHIYAVMKYHIVWICPRCKTLRCIHCETFNVTEEHINMLYQRKEYQNCTVPHGCNFKLRKES